MTQPTHFIRETLLRRFVLGGILFLSFPMLALAAVGPSGSVDTLSANSIDGTMVDARASVYVSAPSTNFFVEYGPTPSMGRQTSPSPTTPGKVEVLMRRIYHLTPNVTYYYRAVLEGPAGVVYGETKTFTAGFGDDSAYLQGAGAAAGTPPQGTTTTQGGTAVPPAGSMTGAAGNALGGTGTQEPNLLQNPGGFFQRLFDAMIGARPAQISVAMAPEEPDPRQVIEYVVAIKNGSTRPIGAGTLSITLPDAVVYLGDNSGGKTALSKVTGGQKITLATGEIRGQETQALTVMALATSNISGSPRATADFSYANPSGALQRVATRDAAPSAPLIQVPDARAQTAAAANGSGILPSSFLAWLIFLIVVTATIVIVRRILFVYQERRKRLLVEAEKKENGTPSSPPVMTLA